MALHLVSAIAAKVAAKPPMPAPILLGKRSAGGASDARGGLRAACVLVEQLEESGCGQDRKLLREREQVRIAGESTAR